MRFDEGALIKALGLLPPRLRAAFAASCAERHLLLYENFRRLSGRGGLEPVAAAMRHLWQDLEEDGGDIASLSEHLARVVESIPGEDMNSDWRQKQACAEDAAAAVAYALRCRISGEAQDAAWAARRCYELADRVAISALAGPNVEYPDEELIVSQSRVQHELRLQKQAIDLLRSSDSNDQALLQQALHRVREWSVGQRYGGDDCY